MYLDDLISDRREKCMKAHSMNMAGINTECDITPVMRETFEVSSHGQLRKGFSNIKNSIVGILRKTDQYLQTFYFYRRYLRVGMKKIVRAGRKNIETIRLVDLLKLPEDDFLKQLYFLIYNSEPEQRELDILKEKRATQKVKRLDLFYEYYYSVDNLWPKRIKQELPARILYKNK